MPEASIKIIYLCDRKACNGSCPNPDCEHTYDVMHAINFEIKQVDEHTVYFVEK